MTSPALIAAFLVWALLATGLLRTMSIARRVDELTARQWRRLARMRSSDGVAFFPTTESRLELEVAIADAIGARRECARRRRSRRHYMSWRALRA